jgi:RimJ/RimL family protein N-acetyltransferase
VTKQKVYACLSKQEFGTGNHRIEPIRSSDRYLIMDWRNEQLYHLRQSTYLTKEKQDIYFDTVVSDLFDKQQPDQILFSYFYKEQCVGYGGLVHINWTDKNAEISFIMDTKLEEEFFQFHWSAFLTLIEELAFEILGFHKLYVYAFNLRPHLYTTLETNKYFRDATLKEHVWFQNKFIDVVIHSKISEY